MNPLKLPLLLTPLTYIHVGNPSLLPRGEKGLWGVTIKIIYPDPANVVMDTGLRRHDAICLIRLNPLSPLGRG